MDCGDTNITQYGWDTRNRLTQVSHFATFAALGENQPDQVVGYLYDVENRWIGRDIDVDGDGQIDHQTRFAYDGNQIVLEFDSSPIANPQSPIPAVTGADLSHRYLWQPEAVDQLMADEQLSDVATPGEVVWPLADHLGTVRDLAIQDAETGVTSVANHRVYDSFGNRTRQAWSAAKDSFRRLRRSRETHLPPPPFRQDRQRTHEPSPTACSPAA